MSAVVARRLAIRGRVQGVGFRDGLCRFAREAGAIGWVRNRRDGSVEALVQGPSATVDAVLHWARRGPPAARVDAIDVEDAATDAALAAFEFRPTA
jgi:acylphosphatase